MTEKIKKVAVIGAGTMGGGIAAHCANAGMQVVLLDMAPTELTPEEQAKGLTLEFEGGAQSHCQHAVRPRQEVAAGRAVHA